MRHGFVLQQLSNFFADAIKESHARLYCLKGFVQGCRYALRLNAIMDRSFNHPMFLNGRQPIDSSIVRERLVVKGYKTIRFSFTQFIKRNQAKMSVREEVHPRLALLRINHQRLDQSDHFDRFKNGFVSLNTLLRVFDLPHRQDAIKRHSNFAHLKSDLCLAHAASFCASEILRERNFGMVGRDSALSRLMKFSSPASFAIAVMRNVSFWSHSIAFLMSIFCFWLSLRYALFIPSELTKLFRTDSLNFRRFPKSRRWSMI